jgi:hypothetical protein
MAKKRKKRGGQQDEKQKKTTEIDKYREGNEDGEDEV